MITVQEVKDLYGTTTDAWSQVYQECENDLYFISDLPGAQWDEKAYENRRRKGRPALSLDQLDKFINQVVNDEKMSTPTINIVPDGSDSSKEDAEIFQGIIRNIEYQSDADTAYDTGAESAVKCSLGFIKIDHEFEDNGFDQRLVIKRCVNYAAFYIDPDSVNIDGSDAMYAFEIEEMTDKDFKKLYPDKAPISFTDNPMIRPQDTDVNIITIAQFYKIDETEKTIGQLDDGTIEEAQDDVSYARTRKIKDRTVRRYKFSGEDMLEETTFPGRYIPIIPVYGKEMWRDGKRYLHSLIRKAKSGQQLFNLWKSLETEILMRQPRANFIGPAAAVGDRLNDYKNPEDVAYLAYEHQDEEGNPIPPPTQMSPPQFPSGVDAAAQGAIQAIKDSMGIYDASLGMRSNETSGIAIKSRQQEGDVATFHFSDNRVKSITQVGRVLLFAIPEVYDTPRILQMIDMEENPKTIGINGEMVEGQEKPIDLKKGKFTVKVTTGASFLTRRQESADFMQSAITADPELMKVIGDLYFENLDMPGSQEIANRIKKTMPPNLVEDDGKDPMVAQLQMQLQQATQALQMLQQQLQAADKTSQQKDAELMLKAKEIDGDSQIAQADLALKSQQMQMDAQSKQIDLQEKQVELQIKQLDLEIKRIEADATIVKLNMQQAQAMQNNVANTNQGVYNAS